MGASSMLIKPEDHYRTVETNVNTSKDLAAFIKAVEDAAASNQCDVYWRGQARQEWPLSSSLARLATSTTALTDAQLNTAEATILSEARQWMKESKIPDDQKPQNELEWLAYLQHHSIPTRLIDFSRDPLVAAFFASESHNETEGRLFATLVPQGKFKLSAAEVETTKIGKIPVREVRLWEPRAEISPRLAAQNGVFLMGRLPSTHIRREAYDEGARTATGQKWTTQLRPMLRAEVVETMSLPFDLISLGTTWRKTTLRPRTFTARIHVDKASIREQLAQRSPKSPIRPDKSRVIDHKYCYPDVDGMFRFSDALKVVRRGLN